MNQNSAKIQSKNQARENKPSRHPILVLHQKIRDAYYQSDATPDEKRAVQIKESQISALNDANMDGASRINWFFDRIQTMTRSSDSKDYAAAVDVALFYSQHLWLKGLKKFNQ
ncbi:hypothetical protein GALL_501430 [mine drainage metagenome]|uniref:Uncharacterized protein n=1 Tax=mine drainage metagenome TaxID=410659 RepID=A0A1J5PL22_9ZZZZ